MNEPIIDLPSPPYELGETVSGVLRWMSDREGKLDAVTLTLGWYTEGRGEKNEATVASLEVKEPGRISAGLDVSTRFQLKLPEVAPPSHDGRIIRVIWRVRARLHLPWATDRHAEAHLVVMPVGGRKALWTYKTATAG